MKKSTILFDLDGTLVNTEEGVTKSFQYALEKYGILETNLNLFRQFIGPPLEDSFQKAYGFSLEKAKEATAFFRERYGKLGMYECELYPEVKECLEILKEKGYRIAVASSKQEPFCCKILEHFQVAQYFEIIGGGRKEENISTKIQVLEDVLARLNITDKKEVVLIGDTKYDARGALEAGIDCIGVTYGFEQELEEMRKAGVVEIFDTLKEVVKFLELEK